MNRLYQNDRNANKCGSKRLRLRRCTAHALAHTLWEADRLPERCLDDAGRKLLSDEKLIDACLRSALSEPSVRLPSRGKRARLLVSAREIVAKGERPCDLRGILRSVHAFDLREDLRIRELTNLPAALRIAVCEALAEVCGDILSFARMRLRAEQWIYSGGRGRIPSGDSDAFFACAMRLAEETERAQLREKLDHIMDARKRRAEWVLENAHRISAHNAMRLENLLDMRRLLDTTDWQEVFCALSQPEAELEADPSGIYPNMDTSSKVYVRTCLEELSDGTGMSETLLARVALRLAGEAADAGAEAEKRTVCYYLDEDGGRALLRKRCGIRRHVRRCLPDGNGWITIAIMLGLTALLSAAFVFLLDKKILAVYVLPLAWSAAVQLISRFFPSFVRPRKLLKLKLESVPNDARTLVTLPVLISGKDRARETLRRVEALGCLEKDANIDFLILADHKDADSQSIDGDEAVTEILREGLTCMNGEAGREKYFYLHRGRSYRAADGRWMGENRKRGAVMALNRLLLGYSEDTARVFSEEYACASRLVGKYRFAVTLDADTEYLPGTVQKLIGAMLHPMNRKYAVLQPCMELTADAVKNRYTQILSGMGGLDGYGYSVSDFYQDMTGFGNFAGKGIYDIRRFYEASCGDLPNDSILSHDLLEGILAGAGFANDVRFYDGCPTDPASELMRLHRWTRGDWQLLPLLFSRRLKLTAVGRLKMAGNLLSSLSMPALALLLVHALWVDAPAAFTLGLALAFLDPLLRLFRGGKRLWQRAVLRLALLPAYAECSLDAILRTFWRLFVSRRHLMDWVTAADAGADGKRLRLIGRTSAILFLPGLLRPQWLPAALALGLLFWTGTAWAEDLAAEETDGEGRLNGKQIGVLNELAQETWRYFEDAVPEDGCGLPPDNVQWDPPVGKAMRTSPTDIGLYMMACVAAHKLGYIGEEILLKRLTAAAETLEKLEKWHGQLYNWYDITTLEPLRPRYVSAVDSGNLAGALLLCAQTVRDRDADLYRRLRALAYGMDLSALYDPDRRLFRIGADIESGRPSASYYDLYASESRILSYCAIMMDKTPISHWSRLARPLADVEGQTALLSWSGTMFEYLMPELLMRSHRLSLCGQTRIAVTQAQKRFGRLHNRPWGISESGYYAFDLQLNYQYRAFGMKALALNGDAVENVVSPYASALALCTCAGDAADNLIAMRRMGWSDAFGMFEAADFSTRDPKLVGSHMTHHQGMILCALCNALRDHALNDIFMDIPEARALRLLLQERPAGRIRARKTQTLRTRAESEPSWENYGRQAKPNELTADVQLLHGGGTTALVDARGAVHAWSNGIRLNRFSGRLGDHREGLYVHLTDADSGEQRVFGASGDTRFEAGSVCMREELGGVRAQLRIAVSPENGAVVQLVTLKNETDKNRQLIVTGCFSAALAPQADMRAHAVFQNLFVRTEKLSGNALLFVRNPREAGKEPLRMIYRASDGFDAEFETDLDRLIGRSGALGIADGISHSFGGTTGNVLDPCGAIRLRVPLRAGDTQKLYFCLRLGGECRDCGERAIRLGEAHAAALLRDSMLDPQTHRLAQRAAAVLFDPSLKNRSGAETALSKKDIWTHGISGDLPILFAELDDREQLRGIRDVIRLHGFYRQMGVYTDLVIADRCGVGYRRDEQDALRDSIDASHLHGMHGKNGGVFLLSTPDAALCEALRFVSALCFRGDAPVSAQLRAQLCDLRLFKGKNRRFTASDEQPKTDALQFFNGFGGFDGEGYTILLDKNRLPPAPWSNILCDEAFGALLTDRAGGFAWFGNSRSGRLTPFGNDALNEGCGWMLYLAENTGDVLRLLPGDRPLTRFKVRFSPNRCEYASVAEDTVFSTAFYPACGGMCMHVCLRNRKSTPRKCRLICAVDWLMGTTAEDAAFLRTWNEKGSCFAVGVSDAIGFLSSDRDDAFAGCSRGDFLAGGSLSEPKGFDALNRREGGWILQIPITLRPNEEAEYRFLLGGAEDMRTAVADIRSFKAGKTKGEGGLRGLDHLTVETPDTALNRLMDGFLQSQILNGRILGRTGLYQPGGAYGFRDQLQDMLAMLCYQPQRVRAHLLKCASRQFEDGDVLHWWHEPCAGVRTHISDDLLFLPYAVSRYVLVTEDHAILRERIPYLRNVPIPEGREDIYAPMQSCGIVETLHEHCMRAFRRADRCGENGMCLMGSGDWNDGMNRVGADGRGESVWLSEFMAACAEQYAKIAPNEADRSYLTALRERLIAAVEANGWDGEWYLRAYDDAGEKLGSAENEECRIDVISQAWAELTGLDAVRCKMALDSAWRELTDEENGVIRLLTPPFSGKRDTGYIAAYPQGIRENGAQYTHAACWLLCALIHAGDADRAHRALDMLLPVNHADTKEKAERYRVEPYVMAADVYTDALHTGRGGWTWYTGAASWMLQAILMLLGYEKRGDRVRLCALLGDWERVTVTVRYADSEYRLICDRNCTGVQLDGKPTDDAFVRMENDGKTHTALFPPRMAGSRMTEEKN